MFQNAQYTQTMPQQAAARSDMSQNTPSKAKGIFKGLLMSKALGAIGGAEGVDTSLETAAVNTPSAVGAIQNAITPEFGSMAMQSPDMGAITTPLQGANQQFMQNATPQMQSPVGQGMLSPASMGQGNPNPGLLGQPPEQGGLFDFKPESLQAKGRGMLDDLSNGYNKASSFLFSGY